MSKTHSSKHHRSLLFAKPCQCLKHHHLLMHRMSLLLLSHLIDFTDKLEVRTPFFLIFRAALLRPTICEPTLYSFTWSGLPWRVPREWLCWSWHFGEAGICTVCRKVHQSLGKVGQFLCTRRAFPITIVQIFLDIYQGSREKTDD